MQAEIIRNTVRDALTKGLYSTAILLAQELVTTSDCSSTDKLLLSQCYFQNGEHRRCLAALEHGGFLVTEMIKRIFDYFHSSEATPNVDVLIAVDAMQLAGQCLLATEQYDDCIVLLEPFILGEDSEDLISTIISNAKALYADNRRGINTVAGIFYLIGRCYDMMDNRVRSIRSLYCCIRIDPQCLDAAHMLATCGALTSLEKQALFDQISLGPDSAWLKNYYISLVGSEDKLIALGNSKVCSAIVGKSSLSIYIKQAENLLEVLYRPEEAYRVVRQAYALDPFEKRCIHIYVACLVELGLKTELFYLGHELTSTMPKHPISWFTVGCYYWSCKKYEMAQSFLRKCTKIDKRFGIAFVMLGLVLSAQEESEQAISAFRAAARLLPGDHRPLILLAKELVRTNYDSLALHFLNSALTLVPGDAVALNELGVIYLRLHRDTDAVDCLEQAAEAALRQRGNSFEIFYNYATALRRTGKYFEALHWYDVALAESPNDVNVLAAVGFTQHLLRRFEQAIGSYHRALAISPSSTFCNELLTRAMEDSVVFQHDNAT